MIYLFNSLGACVQKSSAVNDLLTDLDGETVLRQIQDMATLDVVDFAVSDNDYELSKIYYNGTELKVREENPCTLTGLEMHGLPVPCHVKINDTTYQWDEPDMLLDFPQPGTYKITVIYWPFLDKSFEVVQP